MATISEISLRNFKSFRNTHIPLSKGFVCIVGPNGSGKSNICDSIRFAFGETSLRALRAHRVQELIHGGGEKAMIRLRLEGTNGGDGAEIIRAIRSDGKTLYRLNGRRATRSVVTDYLRTEGLDIGPHNIIAQGEVEKIIRLTPKERRGIIDDIAGISEFEEKKKESLAELGKVDQKLSDATIVLKEREGILQELEQEKDAALQYLAFKDEQRRVKGTLVVTQYKKVENEFTGLVHKVIELSSQKEKLAAQTEGMGGELVELDGTRQEISSAISAKDNRNIYMEVEELKGRIKTDENVRDEKSRNLERVTTELRGLEKEETEIAEKLSKLTGAKRSASARAAELRGRLELLEKQRDKCVQIWDERKRQLKVFDDKLDEKQKQLSAVQQEMTKLTTQVEISGAGADGEKRKKEIDKEMKTFGVEIERLNSEIESAFRKEKELNLQIQSLDANILRIKEEIAAVRGAARVETNPAIAFVAELREKNSVNGIFGAVSELFTAPKEYQIAAEVAAGARVNYFVVKDRETSAEIIKTLKVRNVGRATFIPLDIEVRSGNERPPAGKGVIGRLIDLVKFDSRFAGIFNYVFGDTLLVENVDVFKRIQGWRMVTPDGDIAEASGVMTGGSAVKRSVKEKHSLIQFEREVEGAKKVREEVISELYSISELMSKLRRKIAEFEIKKKELEIELGSIVRRGDVGDAKNTIVEKEADIQEIEREVLDLRSEKERIRLAIENSEDKKEVSKFEDEIVEIKTELSAIEEKLKGEGNILLQERLTVVKRSLEELSDIVSQTESDTKEIERRLKQNMKTLEGKEEKIKDESRELQKLYEKMKVVEEKVNVLGVEKGRIERKIEKIKEDQIRCDVTKGALETRLADLKAEADLYKDIELIDTAREQLEARSAEIEVELQKIGFANLKAPEMYGERLKDYNEIKSKASVLSSEKEAIMKMIDEIDTKKKDIFMKTFNAVNDHFKKLAYSIFQNEAALILENESNPFEGGLHIVLHVGKKGRSIEAMSGGEKSLLTIAFVFSIHMYRPSQFYILDEVEAALDKENSKKFAQLVKNLSSDTQFIVVSHNDSVIPFADIALGVTRTKQGSRIVSIKLTNA